MNERVVMRDRTRQPRIRANAWVIGVAGLAGLIVAQQLAFWLGAEWLQAILRNVAIVVFSGAALGWIIWCVLRRRQASRSGARAVIEHLALATAFSAALTFAIFAVSYVLRPRDAMAFLTGDAVWQFAYGFVIYGAIAVGAHAARAEARLKERELVAARAELQALRARLNPHFLFNTLHSLTQLAREDPSATESALERFGELMRYVLSAGHDATATVPLEEELEFVHHYLAIERLRIGERLRVTEDIDPDALEIAVPPLLLQPLVENAVRHGLAPRRAGGTIWLNIRLVEDSVRIEVIDDGIGADAEEWKVSAGLGLKAARRQIEARFRPRWQFSM